MENIDHEYWSELEIPKDCKSILIAIGEEAEKYWKEIKGRDPVIIRRPDNHLPIMIGYVPTSDHRVWETLDPPTLAKETQS